MSPLLIIAEAGVYHNGDLAAETALGDGVKLPPSGELNNVRLAGESRVAPHASKADAPADNVTANRPGSGRAPFYHWQRIGRYVSEDEPIP